MHFATPSTTATSYIAPRETKANHESSCSSSPLDYFWYSFFSFERNEWSMVKMSFCLPRATSAPRFFSWLMLVQCQTVMSPPLFYTSLFFFPWKDNRLLATLRFFFLKKLFLFFFTLAIHSRFVCVWKKQRKRKTFSGSKVISTNSWAQPTSLLMQVSFPLCPPSYPWTIDLQTVVFWCRHAACMAVSNTRYLSTSETRVNAGIRGWKLHLSESTYWCQESVGGICFTNKWKAASLQPQTFSNHCSNAIFSNASPGLMVHFSGGEHRGFLKEGVKTYWMAPMSPLNSPTFFLSAHL